MSAVSAYGTRPVKRQRATKAEMTERRKVLVEIISTDGPMSVRQAYYRAVVAGVVPKTRAGYQRVQREVLSLRRDGIVPYGAIVDNTRWMRKPRTWDSAKDALAATAQLYRQALWSTSTYRVEVWVESDSIAGSVYEVTEAWDVPLMACRGYSSETFAYNAAEAWAEDDRVPVVLYIGDHDPHGLEIERDLRTRLRGFYAVQRIPRTAWNAYENAEDGCTDFDSVMNRILPVVAPAMIKWRRIGVTWDQVDELDLPGTTPKKPYGFPVAVEAEALPPQMLRDLLDAAIQTYVDEDQLRVLLAAETSEREILERLTETAS